MLERRRSRGLIDDLVASLGPPPWLLADVHGSGWTRSRIRAAIAAGRLVRPRRGVLAPAYASLTPFGNASEPAIRAAMLVSHSSAAASHESAAVIHDLWIPRPASSEVQLTITGRADRSYGEVRCHESRLTSADVTVVRGLRVTTIARTAVDLARGRRLPEALVAVDGAARALAERELGVDLLQLRDQASRAEVAGQLGEMLTEAYAGVWGWPGSVVVRDAIGLLDPASESPFESRSRGWMAESHLPRPEVAFPVQGASGRWYYADFAWPDRGILGEADGLAKYGQDPDVVRHRLRAERARQRDLEAAGWTVVRWDSAEHPRSVVARLRAALSG